MDTVSFLGFKVPPEVRKLIKILTEYVVFVGVVFSFVIDF
jgi:hypothetical protein